MVDKPQWPLNSEALNHMENELGYNYLNTSFTGTTSAEDPQIQEQDTEQDECCGRGCGCHD